MTNDGRHMMFTVTFKTNATQCNHFVIAFDFLESLLQDFSRILTVSTKELLKRASHARRRFGQAVTVRIVARPPDNGSKCRFDFGPVWPVWS